MTKSVETAKMRSHQALGSSYYLLLSKFFKPQAFSAEKNVDDWPGWEGEYYIRYVSRNSIPASIQSNKNNHMNTTNV